MTTPASSRNTFNSDSGGVTLALDGRAVRHQLTIETAASAGTLTFAFRPNGGTTYQAVTDNGVDLSSGVRLVVFEGDTDSVEITPDGSVPASTSYTIVYSARR